MKTKSLFLGVVRYLLGCIMLAYGVTKILQTQFVILPFDVWQQPLEEVWGGSLAWAFLSFSPWFQVLLGFMELVPAVLLLFRKTTLLGAILMLPVTLSVFLINIALHLWPSTQLLSGVLLALNLSIFLFEQHRVHHLVTVVMNRKEPLTRSLQETLINIGVIGFLLFVFSYPLLRYRSQSNPLLGNWFGQHPNEWSLATETRNDSLLPARRNKLYFMPYDTYSVINDTSKGNSNLQYRLDTGNATLSLYGADTSAPASVFQYILQGDSLLVLRQTDRNGNQLKQHYKRRTINALYRH